MKNFARLLPSGPARAGGNYGRRIMILAALGGIGAAWGSKLLSPAPGRAQPQDLDLLNQALDQEHRAIWTYTVASGKLSGSSAGKVVLALVMANLKDHQGHRESLTQAIRNQAGSPIEAQSSYDLSAYTQAGEGDLHSDPHITKLALALECDLALTSMQACRQLSSPDLSQTAGSIALSGIAHATALRSVLHDWDNSIPVVPTAQVSAATRSQWILKV